MTTTKAKAARMLQHPDGGEIGKQFFLFRLSMYHGRKPNVNSKYI